MTKTSGRKEYTIGTIDEYLKAISSHGAQSKAKSHTRFLLRGQPQDNWDLRPGVFRPEFLKDAPDNLVDEKLKKERHLNQGFRVASAGLRSGNEADTLLYFLQQHYRMPTRLLDWTTSPLAALYFATGGNEYNGQVWMLDAFNFKRDIGPDKVEGIATLRNGVFKRAISVIADWDNNKKRARFPENIFAVRPKYFDRRVALQRSCFTFHTDINPVLSIDSNKTLECILIRKEAKRSLRKNLAALGVDHFTVYGDLEHLAQWLKDVHDCGV